MRKFKVQLGTTLNGYDRVSHRENMDLFLEDCDENGRAVFSHILEWAVKRRMWISWGDPGFSMNVEFGEDLVAFCYLNPPCSNRGQSIWARLRDANAVGKTAITEQTIRYLESQARDTGLFEPMVTGRNLEYQITSIPTDSEVNSLLAWFESVAATIREYGLR